MTDTNQTEEQIAIPGLERHLSPEATAVAQFNIMVDSYARSITQINGKIGGKRRELAALDEAKARLEREIAGMESERNVKFDLMEGVNKLIRDQEDLIRERERAEADEARRVAALG